MAIKKLVSKTVSSRENGLKRREEGTTMSNTKKPTNQQKHQRRRRQRQAQKCWWKLPKIHETLKKGSIEDSTKKTKVWKEEEEDDSNATMEEGQALLLTLTVSSSNVRSWHSWDALTTPWSVWREHIHTGANRNRSGCFAHHAADVCCQGWAVDGWDALAIPSVAIDSIVVGTLRRYQVQLVAHGLHTGARLYRSGCSAIPCEGCSGWSWLSHPFKPVWTLRRCRGSCL